MIPRNAEIYIQDPDNPEINIKLEGAALAQWWADHDAAEARQIVSVPQTISDRQFFQQLAIEAIISEAEAEAAVARGELPPIMAALVDQLPTEMRFPARMLLKGATIFERQHPLTNMIASLFGWNTERVDDFFRAAAAL